MADLERTYNIPLRREFQKVPRYKRTKKAVTAVREFLMKHMKSETIVLGQELNMHLWKDGIKNPPHHVKVTATKDPEGVVRAELAGYEFKVLTQKAKKEDDTSLMGRLKSKMGVDGEEEDTAEEKDAKKGAAKADEKKEATKEASPKEDVAEKKEVKKEAPAEKKEAPAEKKEEKKEVKKEEPKAPAEKKAAPKKESKPAETKQAKLA